MKVKLRCLLFVALSLFYLQANALVLPTSSPEMQGLRSENIKAWLDSLTHFPATDLHHVILLRHGNVVANCNPYPFQENQYHTLYSCSKTLVALAVGICVDQGLLRLEDRVADLLDEAPDTLSVRVEDLLMMSSGWQADWNLRSRQTLWLNDYLNRPLRFAPGSRFEYDSMVSYLLSAIVQRVTKQNLIDFLQTQLFNPLGTGPLFWESSPEGINTGGWGLYAPAEALAKVGQLLLQQGQWEGKQLVSNWWIQGMASTHRTDTWGDPYGWQCWQFKNHPGAWRADGAYGQFIIMVPDMDVVAVILQCSTGNLEAEMELLWSTALKEAADTAYLEGEAYQQLKERQDAYPVVRGKAWPVNAKLESDSLLLADNRLGWNTLYYQINNERLEMEITGLHGKLYIQAANGQWLSTLGSTCPLNARNIQGAFNNIPRPFSQAASYGFSGDTLRIEAHYTNWLTAVKIEMYPSSQGLVVNVKENFEPQPVSIPARKDPAPKREAQMPRRR